MPDEASEIKRDAGDWMRRFLGDLAVVRSANTVRAYAGDLSRWLEFCRAGGIDPLHASPRCAIEFIQAERQRTGERWDGGQRAVYRATTLGRSAVVRLPRARARGD